MRTLQRLLRAASSRLRHTLSSSRLRVSDAGQASTEYLAVTVVGAVLITSTVLAFTGGGFGNSVKQAVCSVAAAMHSNASGCSSDGKVIDYKPPLSQCLISQSTESGGGELTIAFFTIGEKYTFMEQRMADGTIRLTYMGDQTYDAGAGIGAGIEFGKQFQAKLGADVKGGIGLRVGDTYVLKNQKELDDVRGKIDDYEAALAGAMYGGEGGGIALMMVDPPPKTPISFARIDLHGEGNITLGLGVKDSGAGKHAKDPYFDPNIGVKLGVNGSAGATVENNSDTGEKSYTYDLSGAYSGSASWGIGSDGTKKTYGGSLKMTYDKNGKLVKVTVLTTRDASETTGGDVKTPFYTSEKAKAKIQSGQTVYETTTTTIAVNDTNRSTVEGALDSLGDKGSVVWDGITGSIIPSAITPDSNDFQKLLYNEATAVKQYYTGTSDENSFGAEVKLGFKLGFGVNWANSKQSLVDAAYLGAPGPNGGRQMLPFTECVAAAGG